MSKQHSPHRNLLVVGSELEAQIVLSRLNEIEFGGRLYHLPGEKKTNIQGQVLAPGKSVPVGKRAPETFELTDVWGKSVVKAKLPESHFLSTESISPSDRLELMPEALTVSRTQATPDGVEVTLSDGTLFLCQAVLFCDGFETAARRFWNRPVAVKADPRAVQCWSFSTPNLLNSAHWEFRWAAAKSIEILPLSPDHVLVKLRFKSPFGSRLTKLELQDLFSEFGSDTAALFEGLQEEHLALIEERKVDTVVFQPGPGCLAIGRAAWGQHPMLTFDWLSRYVEGQTAILEEQLINERVSHDSFEAQSRLIHQQFLRSEQFVRHHLHNDNAVFRSLRNLVLRVIPNSILAAKFKERIFFTARDEEVSLVPLR